MRLLRVALLGVLTLAAGSALVSCGPTQTATKGAATPTGPRLSLAITPASGATRVPVSTEVGLSVANGAITSVVLTGAGGATVSGSVRDDGSSWIPDHALAYGSTYTAVVSARSADGRQALTCSTIFTTMGRPGNLADYGMYLQQGETYGVAMPVVLEFDPPIPASARAGIQSRLFVTSNPPQPGVWHWASGTQIWYRPPVYWLPGTTITVRAALQGVPFGDGSYGAGDRATTVRIGSKVSMMIDNATKSMKVYQDDRLTRTILVSLGKPSTPSSSGTMVTMSHDYSTIFDTTREGPGGYRVLVYYAMRLTWGGEYIHSAPWSVGDQGHTNVSHGCVNMSEENARWLFGITHVGDPVTVRGTEVKLVDGNGWTAWNESWPEFVKGSALPVPPALANWTPAPPAPATPPVHPSPAASPSGVAEPKPTK
jgi:lipoprotein-anchoring transpeptidase ErfK/SrfK